MSETLYRKYRPKIFADVAEQEHVKNALQNQLRSGTLAHAYLFSGPRGVGKTTIARLLAKAANCEKLADGEPCLKCESCLEIERGATMDIFEIDAASNTGVDHVREMIIDNVRFAPGRMKMKVFIIDEAHMLTTSAFNALLKTLEEPPAYALFILATTELHKVPETIVSRCQRFDFHRLPHQAIVARLKGLVKAEKAKVSGETLETIARRSEGCLRDAESLLGQVLAVDDPSLVLPPSCAQDAVAFLVSSSAGQASEAIRAVGESMERGVRMAPLMDEVLAQLRQAFLLSLGCPVESRYEAAVEKALGELAVSLGSQRLQEMLRRFLEIRDLFERDQFPQMALEVFAAQSAATPQTASDSLPAASALPAIPVPIPTPPLHHSTTPPLQTTTPSPKSQTKIKTTLREIKEKWLECCTQLQEQSATLPLVLQNAEVSDLRGAELHVNFPFQFHASQINDLKNKKLIEQILAKCFDEPILIVADYAPANAEAIVADLIHEFGGSAA